MRHDGDVREKELERENDQLKTDVTKLRAEIDSVMRELQHIMDSKISLEMEISAYRKLLEGEEHRWPIALSLSLHIILSLLIALH